MGKQQIGKGMVFLLFLLVVVGVFLLYTKLTFTGFVTNVAGNGYSASYNLSEGNFNGTGFNSSQNAIVLLTNLTSGDYTSPIFNVNNTEIILNNFVYSTNTPANSTMNFYMRACEQSDCSDKIFTPVSSGAINLTGKYFQYQTIMQTTGASPKLYEVNISYSIPPAPLALSITVDSPQNSSYSNETVLIKMTSVNASNIWFYNGTANEIYTGQINRTFTQGGHVITVWANDSNNNLVSQSVAFSIVYPPRAPCGDGYCNPNGETCAICPSDCGVCANTNTSSSSHSSSSSSDNSDNSDITDICISSWQCDETWSDCVNGTQTRACVDTNDCGTMAGAPTSQTCVVEQKTEPVVDTTVPTTTQTAPAKKNFLSSVGSVITAPVSYVFSNKVRIFIFSGVLLLIIAGFLVYKFVLGGDLSILASFFPFLNRGKGNNSEMN